MGFWDVLLFNVASVVGPRWIAAAARNGTSSIQFVDTCCHVYFSAEHVHSGRTILAVSERGADCMRGRRRRLGNFTDLWPTGPTGYTHFFIFPELLMASAAMMAHTWAGRAARFWRRIEHVPDGGVFFLAFYRGDSEHHRIEHRQVAAECEAASARTFLR